MTELVSVHFSLHTVAKLMWHNDKDILASVSQGNETPWFEAAAVWVSSC